MMVYMDTDVENISSTNNGRGLRFANKLRTGPRLTERMPQENYRSRRSITHRSTDPQGEQNRDEEI